MSRRVERVGAWILPRRRSACLAYDGRMTSLSLGPIALPVVPLLLLAAVWSGGALAARLARRLGRAAADAGDVPWHAAGVGLLVARIAYVARHAEAYLASPLAIVDLRDGGWHGPAGLAAAAAFVAWRWLRRPALRGPIAAGALVAALAWFGGAAALGRWDRPPAPDVELTVLEGGAATTLAQAIAGRPAVVNLWASWCGPCREEMPALEAVQRARPDVAVLRVNQGETEAVVRAWLVRDGRVAQGVLLDPGWRLGKAVGASGLPTTLFFDASGRRVDAHFGVLTEAALHARLAEPGMAKR
jgi:thiol-disulfide isomerase/thioredoxin